VNERHDITEEMIERYVRYPDSLDAETVQRVEALIETDDAVRSVARYYYEYYEQLDEITTQDLTPLMRDVVRS